MLIISILQFISKTFIIRQIMFLKIKQKKILNYLIITNKKAKLVVESKRHYSNTLFTKLTALWL